jgi:hypothetical protein
MEWCCLRQRTGQMKREICGHLHFSRFALPPPQKGA